MTDQDHLMVVLAKFPDAKWRCVGGWQARCPAHVDQDPSLSIGTGKNGKVLIFCHAGCRVEDVLGAVGLQMKDLFPASSRVGWKPRR